MYTKTQRRNESITKQDDYLSSKRAMMDRKPEAVLFYEFEPGVVLDVVLDDTHPIFKNKNLDPDDYPVNDDGSSPTASDPDYGWIGRARVRMVYSQNGTAKEILVWALPLENTGVTEVPLINEVVAVVKYFNNYYYTKKVNIKSLINANADPNLERVYGLVPTNHEDNSTQPYQGPISDMSNNVVPNVNTAALGRYFKFNQKIRAIKRFEGDTVIESRFGSSIRFGAYDDNRGNDNGLNDYSDNGGNPMILFRNRQASILSVNPSSGVSGNAIKFNKGYVEEDINNDGTSVQITSGKTVTKYVTTVSMSMFQSSNTDEQSNFTPPKETNFSIPILSGDQIVVNSDRLIFSSKAGETFHFSKGQHATVTDAEYTVDSAGQMMFTTEDDYRVDAAGEIILTTNTATTINSPAIYLGEYQQANEPVLLGRTTTLWLFTLCNILINNIDIQIGLAQTMQSHTHLSDSGTTGTTENSAVQQISQYIDSLTALRQNLSDLRDTLPETMSQRVFTVGGGGAPGHDGK